MGEPQSRVFGDENLSGVVFRETFMPRARMIGVVLVDASIDGLVQNLTVNGVEVTDYVKAELDRRFPVRLKLRSGEPDDLRAGWAEIEAGWHATTDRIGALDEDQQHARVDGEWSAVQTLQHLVFVCDGWFRWAVLGLPRAFHPMGLAPSFVPDQAAMGLDANARPSFDEVVAVRVEQQREIGEFLAGVTLADLDRRGTAPDRPGWPVDPEQHSVLACLHTLLEEEFAHHRYCIRDLDALA